MGSFVELTAVDGAKTPAYVAMPEGKPRGAVVVLQEIFGVNSHIRSVADRYAAQPKAGEAEAGRADPPCIIGFLPDSV